MAIVQLLPLTGLAAPVAAAAADTGGLTINFFWIIVFALNFLIVLAIVGSLFLKPIAGVLEERRAKIEQGLKDADAARREREAASDERNATLAQARRESAEILSRSQRLADELRESDLAAAREEIQRLHDQAAAEIQAERDRALAQVRGQVADLALRAAGKVVGETLSAKRERRLVEEFLAETALPAKG